MKKALLTIIILVFSILYPVQSVLNAAGGISDSAHDFSDQNWSKGEICLPCHTPHNANIDIKAPLWYHEINNDQVYTTYASSYLKETPGEPGMNSMLCLSCHDGTIAVDSYGGMSGSVYIASDSDAFIDTDLSDDHPVGITWSHKEPAKCSNCHFAGMDKEVKFYDGKVECASCHDPHDNGLGEQFLRISMQGSELCLFCHGK